MACFADDLQPPSLVLHQAKIHYVVYDDSGSKKARKWYWCLSHSIDWRLEKIMGRRGWCVWWESLVDLQVVCNGIFFTINDFPAYGNLSGYSVKGHHAYPVCEKEMSFIQLKHGKKTLYTRHQRFLKPYHPYQWLKRRQSGLPDPMWVVGLFPKN